MDLNAEIAMLRTEIAGLNAMISALTERVGDIEGEIPLKADIADALEAKTTANFALTEIRSLQGKEG